MRSKKRLKKRYKILNNMRQQIIIIAIFVSFFMGGFAMANGIVVPTISVYPDIYYPFDEVLYLEGRASPESVVQINFQKQGSKPINFNVKSDQNGEWVLAEKISLESGDWEVRVRENLANGKFSDWSNPRIIKVLVNGVVIGGIGIKFAALALIIIILLILSGFIFSYFHIRVKRLNEIIVKKEMKEAHESVRDGIAEIRKDLLDELKLLNMSGKVVSNEEGQRKEHILRELDRIEREMNKEIEDIEKVD